MKDKYWKLVDLGREHPELIEAEVRKLSREELEEFYLEYGGLKEEYLEVMDEGDFGDEGRRMTAEWVVGRGRAYYEAALADPEGFEEPTDRLGPVMLAEISEAYEDLFDEELFDVIDEKLYGPPEGLGTLKIQVRGKPGTEFVKSKVLEPEVRRWLVDYFEQRERTGYCEVMVNYVRGGVLELTRLGEDWLVEVNGDAPVVGELRQMGGEERWLGTPVEIFSRGFVKQKEAMEIIDYFLESRGERHPRYREWEMVKYRDLE